MSGYVNTRSHPDLKLSLSAVVKAPCRSTHIRAGVVRGKVDDEVSPDPVYGKVLEIGEIYTPPLQRELPRKLLRS